MLAQPHLYCNKQCSVITFLYSYSYIYTVFVSLILYTYWNRKKNLINIFSRNTDSKISLTVHDDEVTFLDNLLAV